MRKKICYKGQDDAVWNFCNLQAVTYCIVSRTGTLDTALKNRGRTRLARRGGAHLVLQHRPVAALQRRACDACVLPLLLRIGIAPEQFGQTGAYAPWLADWLGTMALMASR